MRDHMGKTIDMWVMDQVMRVVCTNTCVELMTPKAGTLCQFFLFACYDAVKLHSIFLLLLKNNNMSKKMQLLTGGHWIGITNDNYIHYGTIFNIIKSHTPIGISNESKSIHFINPSPFHTYNFEKYKNQGRNGVSSKVKNKTLMDRIGWMSPSVMQRVYDSDSDETKLDGKQSQER